MIARSRARRSIRRRDARAHRRATPRTGVDDISVGRLTHSAPSIDVGLDFEIASVKQAVSSRARIVSELKAAGRLRFRQRSRGDARRLAHGRVEAGRGAARPKATSSRPNAASAIDCSRCPAVLGEGEVASALATAWMGRTLVCEAGDRLDEQRRGRARTLRRARRHGGARRRADRRTRSARAQLGLAAGPEPLHVGAAAPDHRSGRRAPARARRRARGRRGARGRRPRAGDQVAERRAARRQESLRHPDRARSRDRPRRLRRGRHRRQPEQRARRLSARAARARDLGADDERPARGSRALRRRSPRPARAVLRALSRRRLRRARRRLGQHAPRSPAATSRSTAPAGSVQRHVRGHRLRRRAAPQRGGPRRETRRVLAGDVTIIGGYAGDPT